MKRLRPACCTPRRAVIELHATPTGSVSDGPPPSASLRHKPATARPTGPPISHPMVNARDIESVTLALFDGSRAPTGPADCRA